MSEGLRYEYNRGHTKKYRWFPIPSSTWQERAYAELMGHAPPAGDSWQFDYEPRKKASKQAFEEFLVEAAD